MESVKYVYRKGPSLYYVRKGKWVWLCPADASENEVRAAVWRIQTKGSDRLKGVMESYLKHALPKLAMSTQKDYQYIIESELLPTFGNMRPDDVSAQDIAVYLEGRDRQGHGARGNKEMAVLSSVFNHGMRIRACNVNPTYGVRRNKEKPRSLYVTNESLRLALQNAGPGFRHLLWTAYLTGFRQGDLINLRKSAIKPEGIEVRQSKDGKHIIMGWTESLRKVIRRALERSNCAYVLTNETGQKYTTASVQCAMRRMKAKTGAEWRFHDLRAKAESDHASGLGLMTRYKRARRLQAVK